MTDYDAEFEAFADAFRREGLQKIAGSAATISIIAGERDFDVKSALELGASIMLNKPIIVLAWGRQVPLGLRRVAHKVIIADMDTEAGKEKAAREIAATLKDFQ